MWQEVLNEALIGYSQWKWKWEDGEEGLEREEEEEALMSDDYLMRRYGMRQDCVDHDDIEMKNQMNDEIELNMMNYSIEDGNEIEKEEFEELSMIFEEIDEQKWMKKMESIEEMSIDGKEEQEGGGKKKEEMRKGEKDEIGMKVAAATIKEITLLEKLSF